MNASPELYELTILQYPKHEALLRRVARDVSDSEFGTNALRQLGGSLGYAMMGAKALGLAATQVEPTFTADGVPLRVFTMAAGDRYMVVCNPEIVSEGEDRVGNEACLSFASIAEPMRAPSAVRVKFRNLEGSPRELVLSDELARCAVHEEEHLRGGTMVDRMSSMKRGLFMKRVAQKRGRVS